MTENSSVLLSGGDPSSLTRTVTVWARVIFSATGVQVKTPLAGSMLAPAGELASRLKVSVSPGFRSVAEAVSVSVPPISTSWSAMGARFGG